MLRRTWVVAAVIADAAAGPARADNCVDHEKLSRPSDRPCWEVGASMGGLEVLRAPGFFEARAQVLRIGLFDSHGGGRGYSFEAFEWETVDDDVGPDGDLDLATPFSDTDEERMAWTGLGGRYQVDRADWGAYVRGHAVARWYGDMRYLVPSVGLRVGRYDRAAVMTEARFAGLSVGGIDASKRSATRDLDLGLRASVVVKPWLRLEARARYRDVVAADDHHIRDVVAAIGVELAVAGKDGFRVTPVFIGAGVRRGLAAEMTTPAAVELEGGAAPPNAREAWQLLVWIDVDLAVNSSRAVW